MPDNSRKWDQRIARARELAKAYPFATQILLFYGQLTRFQRDSYLQYSSQPRARGLDGTFRDEGRTSLLEAFDAVDVGYLLLRWQPFLSLLDSEAPRPLAEVARRLNVSGADAATRLLRAAWPAEALTDHFDPLESEPGGQVSPGEGAATPVDATAGFERFCAHAFLRPYAESLADRAKLPIPQVRPATCPYCGSLPLVGVLRPEGEGAKRSLICSFCRTEWDYLRIACPSCGERREQKLCIYTSPRFATVRVEACDTCKTYLKTVDLTRDGLAVPEVDDIAAIPLTLWAEENGYSKAPASRALLS